MANPFLVLGGVAVSVITAGIGLLAVPGWVNNANDAAARNDIAQITAAQSAALTERGGYVASVASLSGGEFVRFQPSDGVRAYTNINATGEHFIAVAKSRTGAFFARLSGSSETAKGATINAAVTAAGTTIAGGVTAEGVPVPKDWEVGEEAARNYFANPEARTLAGFGGTNQTYATITDFPGSVTTAARATRNSTANSRVHDLIVGSSFPTGTDVRLIAKVRLSEATEVRVIPRGATNNTTTSLHTGVVVSLPAGVSDLDVTMAVAATSPTTAMAGFTLTAPGTVGATFDITEVAIVEASTGAGYFTGSSGDGFYWVGTPFASQAVRIR